MRRFLTRTTGSCAVVSAAAGGSLSAPLNATLGDTSGCCLSIPPSQVNCQKHSSLSLLQSLSMSKRHASSVATDAQIPTPEITRTSGGEAPKGSDGDQHASSERPTENSSMVDRPARGTAALLEIPLEKIGSVEIDPNVFIAYVRSYLRSERAILERVDSSNVNTARLTHAMRSNHQTLSRLHRAAVFRRVQEIIANRQVGLRVATRLLNVSWPQNTILEGYQRPIVDELHAWIVEVLNGNVAISVEGEEKAKGASLSPHDARIVLQNCTVLLRSSPQLVGPLATIAIRDANTIKAPDALIQLMWAVSRSGAHAPDSFWRSLLERLAQLNKNLHGSIADVLKEGGSGNDVGNAAGKRAMAPVLTRAGDLQGEEEESVSFNGLSEFDHDAEDVEGSADKESDMESYNDHGGDEIGHGRESEGDEPNVEGDDAGEESAVRSVPSSSAYPSRAAQINSAKVQTQFRAPPVGHVFSGLTTRQIFRTLRVLKRERWCGDIALMNTLADQALKNIVFETDAAMFSLMKGDSLSRQGVMRRIRRAADLDISEFLSFLCITGDLGIRFSGNAMKVSDLLISPLVRHLRRDDLTILLEAIDRTQCYSPVLMQEVIDAIPRKGTPRANPQAMLHSTHALRIIVHKPALATQLKLHGFLQYYFQVCDLYKKKQSGAQLVGEIDLLYLLSRRYAMDSAIGKSIRETVDEACFQLERMLQRDMLSLRLVTRALETTITLGMRNRPEYPHVAALLNTRNELLNTRQNGITADVKLLRVLHEDVKGAGSTTTTTTGKDGEKLASAKKTEEETDGHLNTPGEDSVDLKRLFDIENDHRPRIPKAVYDVYNELIHTYQCIFMQRRRLRESERARMARLAENIGVFNFLRGALIMKQLHLRMSEKHVYMPTTDFPYVLPSSVETICSMAILRRLRAAAISEASDDEEVLRLLGQRSFDSERARYLVVAARSSPLTVLRAHPHLWAFVKEVARRFGNEETLKMAQEAEQQLSR